MLYRWVVGAWCLVVALLAASHTAPARPLLIGATAAPPLKWLEDGQPQGIDVDIIAEILQGMAIADYRFVFFRSGTRMLQEARNGRLDLLLSLSYKDDRAVYLRYPAGAHITLAWHFVKLQHRTDLPDIGAIDRLKGLRIGAVRSYAYRDTFQQAGLTLIDVPTETSLLPMLRLGRIDLAPMLWLNAAYQAKQIGLLGDIAYLQPPFRAAPYFNVWARRSDYGDVDALAARYDLVLEKLRTQGRLDAIIARYTTDETPTR